MDLISREAVKEKFPLMENGFGLINERLHKGIDDLPSAFEGMTNGEVIKAMFPMCENFTPIVRIFLESGSYISLPVDWWNSPYQKGGE